MVFAKYHEDYSKDPKKFPIPGRLDQLHKIKAELKAIDFNDKKEQIDYIEEMAKLGSEDAKLVCDDVPHPHVSTELELFEPLIVWCSVITEGCLCVSFVFPSGSLVFQTADERAFWPCWRWNSLH